MTREEAIKMVQAHKFPRPMEEWQRLNNEAIDMAIEALQTEYEDYEHATIVDIKEPLKVAVVRCKDCRHSRVYQTDSKGTMQTYCVAFIMSRTVTDDDFCSWGERREK